MAGTLIIYLFLWIIYFNQFYIGHSYSSFRNKCYILFIPSGINIVIFFRYVIFVLVSSHSTRINIFTQHPMEPEFIV
jgi:hypothetical protein